MNKKALPVLKSKDYDVPLKRSPRKRVCSSPTSETEEIVDIQDNSEQSGEEDELQLLKIRINALTNENTLLKKQNEDLRQTLQDSMFVNENISKDNELFKSETGL